ncbi:hypothetical protein Pelo_11080 [Pelomyxa schiedti]|nr:hypothetical protein Pelo_11080 [Pelomyxa schiedti]
MGKDEKKGNKCCMAVCCSITTTIIAAVVAIVIYVGLAYQTLKNAQWQVTSSSATVEPGTSTFTSNITMDMDVWATKGITVSADGVKFDLTMLDNSGADSSITGPADCGGVSVGKTASSVTIDSTLTGDNSDSDLMLAFLAGTPEDFSITVKKIKFWGRWVPIKFTFVQELSMS